MVESLTSLHVDLLLQHSGWVRALARRLANGDDADDLEQATWLAALTHAPREGVPLREWLGTVLRNFARQEERSASRRTARERLAARAEALAASDEVLARAELQRRIVSAVLELDEPYRATVLLRYFEGLPPRTIAARQSVPVATVRTRLARALERLRRRFAEEHGGERSAWVLAFAPLSQAESTLAPSALSSLVLMHSKSIAVAVLAVFLGAAGWWLAQRSDAPSPSEVVAQTGATPETRRASAPSTGSAAPTSTSERDEVVSTRADSAEVPAAAVVPSSAPANTLRGRVIDATGAPLGNVRMVVRDEDQAPPTTVECRSDAAGNLVLEGAPRKGSIVSGDRAWSTVMRANFHLGGAREPIAVLAPRLALEGEVVDELGNLLEGADVEIVLPPEFRTRFREVLDATVPSTWTFSTGADGSFEFDDVPQIEGSRMRVASDGFLEAALEVPAQSDLALRITLERPTSTDGWVRGIVVDGRGLPIEGAHVACGVDTMRSGSDGGFAFRADDPESFTAQMRLPNLALQALKPGLMPARFEPRVVDGQPQWPAFVKLVLDRAPLAIEGRVVGKDQEPIEGVRVFASDATLFGAVDGRPATVEGLLSGATNIWAFTATDAEGRFRIEGLLDRDYALCALDPSTLLRVDEERVRAGRAGVELELPTDQIHARVAGRLMSHSGQPIAGANVRPMCDAFQARLVERILSTSHASVPGTTTDASGHFELRNVPKSLVYLRIDGESILPLEYGRYVEGDERFAEVEVRELPKDRIEALEIQVEQRCHMQVELVNPSAADQLAALDQKGRELIISLFESNSRQERARHPIHEGRSRVLSVPDSARTLVLFKAGVEIGRTKLALDPKQTTTVKF